jgi:hypothetical protein
MKPLDHALKLTDTQNNTTGWIKEALSETVSLLNEVRLKEINVLWDKYDHLQLLLPNTYQNQTVTVRSRRGWLNFIGDYGHTAFGLATDRLVNQLAKHVDHLYRQQSTNTKRLQRIGKELSSIVEVAHKSIDRINQALAQTRWEINILHSQLKTSLQTESKLEYWHANTIILLRQKVLMDETFSELHRHADAWLSGVQLLLDHRLPVHMVS